MDRKSRANLKKYIASLYDGKLTAADLKTLLDGTAEIVDDKNSSLWEVLVLVEDVEENLTFDVDYSKEWYVFSAMLEYVEVCEENAKRVYEDFLEHCDLNLLFLIGFVFREYYTDEQYALVKKYAHELYDDEALASLPD